MMWLAGVGFFATFMIGFSMLPFILDFGINGLLVWVGVVLTLIFIAVIGAARQYEKKHRARVVLGPERTTRREPPRGPKRYERSEF